MEISTISPGLSRYLTVLIYLCTGIPLVFIAGFVFNFAKGRPHDALLRVLSIITAVSAFLLLFLGGLVTSHQAGLSVPDWPTSYGWNMFTFPMKDWKGGIFYEHTHRLFASYIGTLIFIQAVVRQELSKRGWLRTHLWPMLGVIAVYFVFGGGADGGTASMVCFGLLVLAQTVAIWRADMRPGINQLTWLAATGVTIQGILGGLTVKYYLPPAISTAHAGLGQAVFCLTLAIAMMTSPRWALGQGTKRTERTKLGLRTLSLLTVCAIFCQLLIGAVMRHTNSGLAIPTFPFAPNGSIIPDFTSFGVAINFTHRCGAVVVALLMFLTARTTFRFYARDKSLAIAMMVSMFLLGLQIMLGAITIWTAKAVTPATLHVSCGAALLGIMTYVMISSRHRYAAMQSVPAKANSNAIPVISEA